MNDLTFQHKPSLPLRCVQSVLLIIAALLASAGATALTRAGYDWGYQLVQHLFGQPSSDQLTGAAMLGFWFIPGVTIGIFLGYVEKARKAAVWRYLLAPICIAAIFAPFVYQALRESISVADLPTTLNMTEYISFGVATVIGYCSNFIARHAYAELKLRTHALRLTGSLLVGLYAMLLLNGSWLSNAKIELGVYCLVLGLVGFIAPLLLKVKSARAGWAAAVVATLPVTLFDLTNVLFTLTFLVTNLFGAGLHLGWRATLSASIITVVSFAAASVGGLLGGSLSAKIRGDNLVDINENSDSHRAVRSIRTTNREHQQADDVINLKPEATTIRV